MEFLFYSYTQGLIKKIFSIDFHREQDELYAKVDYQ